MILPVKAPFHVIRCCFTLIVVLLSACAAPLPTASPTRTPPLPSTAAPTHTAVIAPTATPRPSPTATRSPSAAPTIAAIMPAATAAGLLVTGWSPDSRLLAYRSFTAEDFRQNPNEGTSVLPYGTFHLLDVRTEIECQYPKDNSYGLQFNLWHAWLPDGRLLTLDGDSRVVVLADACDGASASLLTPPDRPPCLITNPDSNQTCSPDGMHMAETDESEQPHTTTVYSTITGQVEAVVPWPYSETGIGHIGGPEWLNNQRFIIRATDNGPLLVTLGSKSVVENITETFFGRPGTTNLYATGSLLPGTADFHLLMFEHNDWRLYHSESGKVEVLDAFAAYLSPDGRWVELFGKGGNPGWVRPIDPPGSPLEQFLSTEDWHYGAGWSSDWSRVAIAGDRSLRTDGQAVLRALAMPGAKVLNEWTLGPYYISGPIWSPDNHFLAVVGSPTTEAEQALFAMEVSP